MVGEAIGISQVDQAYNVSIRFRWRVVGEIEGEDYVVGIRPPFQSAFAGEWLERRTISNTFCEGNQLPVRQPGQSKDNFQLFF